MCFFFMCVRIIQKRAKGIVREIYSRPLVLTRRQRAVVKLSCAVRKEETSRPNKICVYIYVYENTKFKWAACAAFLATLRHQFNKYGGQ